MTDTLVDKPTEHIRLRVVAGADVPNVFLLPVAGFPIPDPDLALIRKFVATLTTALEERTRSTDHIFLQHAELDFERGAPLLSKNAPRWKPKTGLGVWPDREPPSFWKAEEFMSIEPAQRPRPLMHKVFRIMNSQATTEVRETLFGTGCLLEILISGSAEAYLKKTTALLLPAIMEESFRNFPFYLPLLEAKSFQPPKRRDDSDWLAGATAYIRESREDQAILIIARDSLDPILTSLGGRMEPGSTPEWRF